MCVYGRCYQDPVDDVLLEDWSNNFAPEYSVREICFALTDIGILRYNEEYDFFSPVYEDESPVYSTDGVLYVNKYAINELENALRENDERFSC